MKLDGHIGLMVIIIKLSTTCIGKVIGLPLLLIAFKISLTSWWRPFPRIALAICLFANIAETAFSINSSNSLLDISDEFSCGSSWSRGSLGGSFWFGGWLGDWEEPPELSSDILLVFLINDHLIWNIIFVEMN